MLEFFYYTTRRGGEIIKGYLRPGEMAADRFRASLTTHRKDRMLDMTFFEEHNAEVH